MIAVYQIHLTDDQIIEVNKNGHDAVDAQSAKVNLMCFGEWKDEYAQFYTLTYKVDSDDLDEVFELTNIWSDENKVKKIRRGHSTSVGDIFVKEGRFHLVKSFGFEEIGDQNIG